MDFENEIAGLFALRRKGMDGDAAAYVVARERLAVALPQAAGPERARLLQVSGQVERDLGRGAAAIAAYQEAADTWRSLADRDGLAHALRHIGDIYVVSGDAAAGLPFAAEAAGLLIEAEVLTRANGLRVLALCYDGVGRPARETWVEAQGLYRQAGIEAGVEECRRHLRTAPPTVTGDGPPSP